MGYVQPPVTLFKSYGTSFLLGYRERWSLVTVDHPSDPRRAKNLGFETKVGEPIVGKFSFGECLLRPFLTAPQLENVSAVLSKK